MATSQHDLCELCHSLPFVLKSESEIFYHKSSSHFILRIPSLGNLVIKEDLHGYQNLSLFIEKLKDFSMNLDFDNHPAIISTTNHLVTRKYDFFRVSKNGGTCIFRHINEIPRDIPNQEMISIQEILTGVASLETSFFA